MAWRLPGPHGEHRGFLDATLNFLVKPNYANVEAFTRDVAVFRTEAGWTSSIGAGARSFRRGAKGPTPTGVTSQVRLTAATGEIVVAPTEYSDMVHVGDGLWKTTKYVCDIKEVGFRTADGSILVPPQFSEVTFPFTDGVTLATSVKGDALLIDTQGRTPASFAALFPDLANRDDGQVTRTLDRRFDPDPAAERGERPPLSRPDAMICRDPHLRALSRETEQRFYSAQTGDRLPQDFMALLPAYHKAIDEAGYAARWSVRCTISRPRSQRPRTAARPSASA
jgi:hypothetical protein